LADWNPGENRQIVLFSAIIGGASAIRIVVGIVEVKVLAVLLGTGGVGFMALYQSIMGMASILAACGLGNSGVRQLAASVVEVATLAVVRRHSG
jgi:O-antigen/teichoic acid export membrane protein